MASSVGAKALDASVVILDSSVGGTVVIGVSLATGVAVSAAAEIMAALVSPFDGVSLPMFKISGVITTVVPPK